MNELKEKVIEKLNGIKDIEVPISIYELGLVYKIEIDENMNVDIDMTVINSRCASTKSLTDLIIEKVKEIDEIKECTVKFVFTPKWEVTMIKPEGLEKLREIGEQ